MMPSHALMRRGLLVFLVLLLVVAGVVVYRLPAAAPVREMLRSVKDRSQDAATTSKVKTALLLSKHVSAFDIQTATPPASPRSRTTSWSTPAPGAIPRWQTWAIASPIWRSRRSSSTGSPALPSSGTSGSRSRSPGRS